ncbi:MAG: DEAD/DEAH box helicase [Acidimicrobiales bacterium]
MLAVHLVWDHRGGGSGLVWAEDSERPATCPPRRGRRPAVPRPRSHPFATTRAHLVEVLAGSGSSVLGPALAGADEDLAVMWLPGTGEGPGCSPQVIRDDEPSPGARRGAASLARYSVPAVRLRPGPALDAVLALADLRTTGVHVGASVTAMAAVAGLALDVAAGGRVLPDLVAGPGGTYQARWLPVGGGADEDRIRLLGAALPPFCRALDVADGTASAPPETPPLLIVRHALGAFVDAICRDAWAVRGGRRSRSPTLVPGPQRPAGRPRPVLEAWLEALVGDRPDVVAGAAELAELERSVAEWRASAAGRGGPWRLCFRLREPPEDVAFDQVVEDSAEPHAPGGKPQDGWRVELLLQATDDLSLLVDADQVWSSGTTLRHATRTVEAPHETLLSELGRAVRAYPELSSALRQPAPTGLDVDLAGAHRFLAEIAPALEVAGFGVLLPSWWRRPASRLGVRLRASGHSAGGQGTGLLSSDGLCAFDWKAALGDQEIGMSELRRLAKLKAPLVRVRGRWMELRPGEVDKLVRFLESGRGGDRSGGDRSGGDRSGGDRAMSVAEVLRLAAGADEAVAGVPVVGVEADGVLGALLRGELEDSLEVAGTPQGFVGSLRPYQERGVAWLGLLERTGLGACLADDMGLGKTATVLALLQAERTTVAGAAGPTLVVCPTSVVGNWQREAERFTPGLGVHVHHGAARARAGTLAEQLRDVDLVITSYSLLDRDRTALAGIGWSRIVLDEAQNVKNPDAKQTKAVRALRAPRRIALTGTPVENHLGELWSIMEILNPGLLGSASAFRERFSVPIERYREQDAADQLRTLTQPFVLRRLKTDRTIITDLPEKFEMKVPCMLTREQATLYQAVVDEMLRRIDETDGIERKGLVLATMLRLKQVCNHPAQYLGDGSALGNRSGKLERTVEILSEVIEGGEKALVFTQFAEMGELLREHLQHSLGCRVAFLHGGVPRKRRDAMVQAFQATGGGDTATDADADHPIMVLSLKAGGTGLNLTAANHVVHFDRWWNPAVENQATDRAFRIGQRRDVQVRKLVCSGTLEERIDQMIESKRDLAERIVGAGESWLTELSTDQLADVFRLSAELVESR